MIQDLPLEENEPEFIELKEEEDNENMVVVKPTKEHSYFLDPILVDNLDWLKKEVLKKDYDGFIVVDGQEGMGKSTLACQLATYLDPNFNLDKICFTIEQFIEAVENAKKGDAILFDETMGYLSSRGAMSNFNKILIKIFSEMRSKNLFIFLCIPSFFELDKYPAIHRSVSLIHIHKRRHFFAYNYQKKKILYITGKKYYSYKFPPCDFFGNFTKYFTVNKELYEKKKQEGIKTFYSNKLKPKKEAKSTSEQPK